MPINIKYLESFQENEFMHVICKAVGHEFLFNNDQNKKYFLKKYDHYLGNYLDTYAYCLLDNHVHWLVKCKQTENLKKHIDKVPVLKRKSHQSQLLDNKITYEQAIEFQFKDFFISYAMSFNKINERSGALFINPFRRISLKDENHLIQLIVYIHANQIKHGLKKKIETCTFTSYQSILSEQLTSLKRDEIFNLFGNKNSFIKIHESMVEYYYTNRFSLED
jgi:REP element-mobilizing transposase RayT